MADTGGAAMAVAASAPAVARLNAILREMRPVELFMAFSSNFWDLFMTWSDIDCFSGDGRAGPTSRRVHAGAAMVQPGPPPLVQKERHSGHLIHRHRAGVTLRTAAASRPPHRDDSLGAEWRLPA